MKRSILEAGVLTFAFAVIAAAQNAPQNPATNPGSQKVAPPIQFSSLDTNKDGRVSKEEVRANVELNSTFATLDTNKDSYLSEAEFGKWQSPDAKPPSGNMNPPGAGASPQSVPSAE